MKILYLCADAGIPVLGRKGAAVHVRQLIAAFARAGHDVVLAVPTLNKSPWEQPAEVAASLVPLRPSSVATGAVHAVKSYTDQLGDTSPLSSELRRILGSHEIEDELRRRFADHPPDFIYERASLFATAGVTLAREFGVPRLLELNAPLVVEQSAYRGHGLTALASKAEQLTLTQADAVLAVSAPLRDHAVALGADPARVHVVPNGVDTKLFFPVAPDAALRRRLGLKRGPVLGFLGGLRPWHGVEVLPELLAQLAPRHDGLQLVFAGEGPLRGDLENELSRRGLRDRVVFTGALAHEEVPGVVRLFDIALAPYPPLEHAFYFSPLKVFEYMACGVAVVASRCGQITEVITDGQNGLLHPPGDMGELIAACDRLLCQPKLRRQLGRAAAAYVRSLYTWDHNAQRVIELAATLVAARPSRAGFQPKSSRDGKCHDGQEVRNGWLEARPTPRTKRAATR